MKDKIKPVKHCAYFTIHKISENNNDILLTVNEYNRDYLEYLCARFYYFTIENKPINIELERLISDFFREIDLYFYNNHVTNKCQLKHRIFNIAYEIKSQDNLIYWIKQLILGKIDKLELKEIK